jgi:D-arabinose 1-dehydrogenase-like Zn-dependent alcohol dehydrogenase
MASVRLNNEDYTVVIGADANGLPASSLAAAGAVTFTRTDNVTAYPANGVIGNGVTGSAIHAVDLGVSAGAEIQLDTVTLTINRTTVPAGMTTVVAHFFTAAPTAIADNAVFSLAAADRAFYAGSATLSAAAVVGGNFLYLFADYIGRKIKLTSSSIFILLPTTVGYTPAAATEHILRVRGFNLGLAGSAAA